MDELDIMMENNNDFTIGVNLTDTSMVGDLLDSKKQEPKDRKEIEIDGKRMKFYTEFETSLNPTSLEPIKLNSYFCIEYDFDEDYDLLYKTIWNVRNLFSFLSYRKNISFRKIRLLKNTLNSYFIDIGSVEYKSFIEYEMPPKEYEKISSFAYDDIKDYLEVLFQNIIDKKIGMCYIPQNHIERRNYTPERIIMIASSFEHAFSTFIGRVEHHEKSIRQMEKLASYIEEIKETKEIPAKERKQLERVIGYIKSDNYSSKVNEVLKKNPYLEEIVRRIYQGYQKNYRRDNFCSVIETIRNSFAHYKIEEETTEPRVVAIQSLEMMVYAMQLYYSKVPIGEVQNRIYKMLYLQ